MILHWSELTKNQFDEITATSVVAVNFSSTEQHSNHLPVGTDAMIGEAVLEEGAKNDWFDDTHILLLTVVAAVAGPIFIWRSLTYRQPIVELRAFGNRNFLVGFIMTFIVGFALFGNQPLVHKQYAGSHLARKAHFVRYDNHCHARLS